MKTTISAGTIARTLILALALLNQVLSLTNHSIIPIEEETINAAVTTICTIGAAVCSWWKNNSFTSAARKGDRIMHTLKGD